MTFIKNHVMLAKLTSGSFEFTLADGYKKEGAICEYGKFFK